MESLFHAQNVGGFPAEMLATVDRDELAGDAGAVEEEPQCGGDVGGVRATAQNGRGALAGEVGLGLPEAPQGGAGADGIDADVRRKGVSFRMRWSIMLTIRPWASGSPVSSVRAGGHCRAKPWVRT